jgi:transposase-like protein
MKQYNKRDVVLLEELYAKLQPWIKNHPNRALYIDNLEDDVCPNCASTNLRARGFALTNMGKFRRFRCHDCGAWSRSKSRISGVTVTHSKD